MGSSSRCFRSSARACAATTRARASLEKLSRVRVLAPAEGMREREYTRGKPLRAVPRYRPVLPALAEFPPFFLYGFLVPFGLLWGSFLNVVIHRLPREQSVVHPRSRCPGCGRAIAAYDNIPIVSYLILRGRARCCGVRISPRYPLVELLGGLLAFSVLKLVVFELPPETTILQALLVFLVYFALTLTLVALAFIDLEFMLLPMSLSVGAIVLGLASSWLRGMDFVRALAGTGFGFLLVFLPFYWLHSLWRGYPGMGFGDAVLIALAGAWFGWEGAVFAFVFGCVQATVVTLAVYASSGKIETPAAVLEERKAIQAEIDALEGKEREELERERDLDPALREIPGGIGKARVPLGPFLALGTLEYALFERVGLGALLDALFHPSL
jgi:leader peptidase (prepilin peptidase) / N-methyltransferase